MSVCVTLGHTLTFSSSSAAGLPYIVAFCCGYHNSTSGGAFSQIGGALYHGSSVACLSVWSVSTAPELQTSVRKPHELQKAGHPVLITPRRAVYLVPYPCKSARIPL